MAILGSGSGGRTCFGISMGEKLPFGIEVVGFSEEEGVPLWYSIYRQPCFGGQV